MAPRLGHSSLHPLPCRKLPAWHRGLHTGGGGLEGRGGLSLWPPTHRLGAAARDPPFHQGSPALTHSHTAALRWWALSECPRNSFTCLGTELQLPSPFYLVPSSPAHLKPGIHCFPPSPDTGFSSGRSVPPPPHPAPPLPTPAASQLCGKVLEQLFNEEPRAHKALSCPCRSWELSSRSACDSVRSPSLSESHFPPRQPRGTALCAGHNGSGSGAPFGKLRAGPGERWP